MFCLQKENCYQFYVGMQQSHGETKTVHVVIAGWGLAAFGGD